MLVSVNDSSPWPFILPLALALTTFPLTVAPRGKAGLPWTLTGCARTARKVCPAWLFFELNAWLVVMVSVVPAGTTTGWGLGFCTGGGAAAIAGATSWDTIASGSIVVWSSTLAFPGSSWAICSSFFWAAGVRTLPLRVTLASLASTLTGDSFVSGSAAALSRMSFAIWSSLGRREHAMDRASKILNIAIEIGERC